MRKLPPSPQLALLTVPLPILGDASHAETLRQFSCAARQEAVDAAELDTSSLIVSSEFLRDHGKFEGALSLCRRAASKAIGAGEGETLGRAWLALVSILVSKGDFGGAAEIVQQLEAISEEGPSLKSAFFHEGAANIRLRTVVQDRFDEAIMHFSVARDLYEASQDHLGSIRCHVGLASAVSGLGHYLESLEHVDAGLRKCETHEDWRYVNRLLLEAALALRDQGYREGVEDLFKLSIEWSEFVCDQVTRIRALAGLAYLHDFEADEQNRDQFARSEREFLDAIEQAEEIGAIPLAVQTRLELVHLYDKFGEFAKIEEQRQLAVREGGQLSLTSAPKWFDNHADYKRSLDDSRTDRAFDRLREAIEGISDPFLIFDAMITPHEREDDLLNEFRNSAADELLGLKSVVVRTLADLVLNPYLRDLREPLLNATNDRVSHQDTISVDGRWFVRRVVPAGAGAVLTLVDVTDSHDAQEALAQAAESAREADRIKTEFLANMSHEVRTPINGVLGLAGLLADSPLTEEQRTYVEGIIASGDILLRVIGDVLDLSKIEADSMAVNLAPTHPKKLLGDVISLYRGQAVSKGIQLRANADLDVPDSVLLDAARVHQILGNLVGNAVKFTQAGSIEVSMRAIEEWLLIEVRDTGPGIPADRLETVFEPFRQLTGRDTRESGTGLGLTISKKLAELMGGSIALTSVLGEGSTFTLRLPLQLSVSESIPTNQTQATPTFKGANILLVEDNPVNILVARGLLTKFGCTVDEAQDGCDALDLFASNQYDAILMDMRLPTVSGVEATGLIRQREQGTSRIPIIALTASTLAEERKACFDAGMDDYIAKPFSEEELRATLAKWLGTRKTSV